MENELITEADLNAFPVLTINQLYYVYFEAETGQIYSITNELSNLYVTYISVDFTLVADFINGVLQFTDYFVGYENKDVPLSILKKPISTSVNNNTFRILDDPVTKKTELVINWNKKMACWEFFYTGVISKKLPTSDYKFFIVDKNNVNYLIRTIEISVQSLLYNNTVKVPFEYPREYTLANINVATSIFSSVYGINKLK